MDGGRHGQHALGRAWGSWPGCEPHCCSPPTPTPVFALAYIHIEFSTLFFIKTALGLVVVFFLLVMAEPAHKPCSKGHCCLLEAAQGLQCSTAWLREALGSVVQLNNAQMH